MTAAHKTIALILAAGLWIPVLAACRNEPAKPPVVGETPPSATAATTASNSSTESPDSNEEDQNPALKSLAFVYNEITLTLWETVDDTELEGILGKAEEVKTHTYSKDDGLNMDPLIGFTEKVYIYPGLELKTIKAPDTPDFRIFQIAITDSKYATVNGIRVGDSVEKLQTAYPEGRMSGEGASGASDDFLYMPVDYVNSMKVQVEGSRVERIQMFTLLY